MLEIIDDARLAAGQVLARRYRLDRIVGEGGMGVVWAATHVLTGKPCALKFLKEHRASDPRSHARLLNEARAACRVRHPNVAQVHDILELANGVPFIVMDLLDGEALSSRLARRGRLDFGEMLPILVQTSSAVAAAHDLGIVHRDLKPDNIFLERSTNDADVVKVLDFGIAKHFDTAVPIETDEGAGPFVSLRGGLTTTYSAVGTPLYMAPEQLHGDSEISAAADVWALGIVVFECLTGARPPRDEITRAVELERARREIQAANDVPRDLVELVLRMMREEPAERPSVTEVEEQLRRYQARHLQGNGIEHAAPATVANVASAPSSATRRWVIPAIAAAGLGAFGLDRLQASSADARLYVDTGAPHVSASAPPIDARENVLPAASVLPSPPVVVSASAPSSVGRSVAPSRRSPPPRSPSASASAPRPSSSHGIPSYQRR